MRIAIQQVVLVVGVVLAILGTIDVSSALRAAGQSASGPALTLLGIVLVFRSYDADLRARVRQIEAHLEEQMRQRPPQSP